MNKTLLFSLLLISSLGYLNAKPHFGFGINFGYPFCTPLYAPCHTTIVERPVYEEIEEVIDEDGRIICRRPIRRHYRVVRPHRIVHYHHRPSVGFNFGFGNWF